jgi:hypothetical protein
LTRSAPTSPRRLARSAPSRPHELFRCAAAPASPSESRRQPIRSVRQMVAKADAAMPPTRAEPRPDVQQARARRRRRPVAVVRPGEARENVRVPSAVHEDSLPRGEDSREARRPRIAALGRPHARGRSAEPALGRKAAPSAHAGARGGGAPGVLGNGDGTRKRQAGRRLSRGVGVAQERKDGMVVRRRPRSRSCPRRRPGGNSGDTSAMNARCASSSPSRSSCCSPSPWRPAAPPPVARQRGAGPREMEEDLEVPQVSSRHAASDAASSGSGRIAGPRFGGAAERGEAPAHQRAEGEELVQQEGSLRGSASPAGVRAQDRGRDP